jgi:N-acyl-D-aspartate/D-glutamate deacylase
LEEAINIGRQAGTPVHISHIKALGPSVWGQSKAMIAAVERAKADGVRVTADQYPWTASGTRISNALVPRWALDGGLEGLRLRLASPEEFARIKGEMVGNLRRRGGPEKLLITGKLGDADVIIGKTLAEIAQAANIDPLDAALAILREGDARVASFVMNANDITAFAKQDWVMTGSDGSNGHPRKYASYPKAYRDFVVEQKTMSLARFVQRSSGQVADMAGLKGRGYLKPGYFADVVMFDPKQFAPIANYQNPRELSQGVQYLLVNGKLAIDAGNYTGALAGVPLLKKTDAHATSCE